MIGRAQKDDARSRANGPEHLCKPVPTEHNTASVYLRIAALACVGVIFSPVGLVDMLARIGGAA